jgi:5-formyltetrahydrofolate cyclo-ligase
MSLFHTIEKQSLRRAALERRAGLAAAERAAAAAAVVAGGLNLAELHAAGGVVALFSSIRDEIDTGPLAAALARAGHALALPAIVEPAAPLQFRRWTPGEELVRGLKGILEPPAFAAMVRPALVFVPLAAFDRRGGRIGYGGGYYDRTLGDSGRADSAARPVAVGLAFAVQEVFRVPDLPHDVRLDHILTERETIACRSTA